MSSSEVAIILPVHNSGKHLAPAIDSIIDNTEHPWKLIIVESESTDGTAELCDKYAKDDRIEVHHTKRGGITKAINLGIDKAGDLDVYLTQDDVILPNLYNRDWLNELVKISEEKNCGAIRTIMAGGVDMSGDYWKGFKWTGTWSLYLPRSTIDKVGKFDEGFSPGPGDDIDMSYRIFKSGLNLYTANFWVDHHRSTQNFNDIAYLSKKNAGYFRRKHSLPDPWSEVDFGGYKMLLMDEKIHGSYDAEGRINDPETIREIWKICKDFTKKDVFIDVGAASGLMTIMNPKGTTIAFEPNPDVWKILNYNCYINDQKVTIIKKPVADRIYNYSLIKNELPGLTTIKEGGGKETTTLDSLEVGDKKIRLLKIDAEGMDLDILMGGSELIRKHKPLIILETPDNGYMESINYTQIKTLGINSLWKSE